MKQILRVLWDGSTQEVVAVASALAAFLFGFLSNTHGALRVGLTVAFGALSALAAIGDAIVKMSENKAAATVTASRVAAQAAQDTTKAAEAAGQIAGALSSLVGPAAGNLAASPSTAGAGMPPGVVG